MPMLRISSSIQKRWVERSVAILIGAWLSVTAACAGDWQSSFPFRRGIGIGHALGWAPVEPGPSRAFVFPPFDQSTKLANELRSLRRTGFDFVRLAVDPGPFLQFRGSQRDQLDEMLVDHVRLILSSGLAVIVDFHPSDAHEDYTAAALTRGVDVPVFQAYLRLLVRTASLLDRFQSRSVALEIMNEPPVSPARWQPMLEAAYSAIRNRFRDLLLVVGGGDEGSAEGTLALGKFSKDPAALFSFHYYDPYQFTHQGAPWVAARYLADVPYPALARSLEDSLDASAALIAMSDLPSSQKPLALKDARQRLESYRRSSFGRATISQSFDRLARWARDNSLPTDRIILGEFGARKPDRGFGGARNAEQRAQWIHDVRVEAEARGFIWSAWVYRGSGGFSLVQHEQGTELDPALIEALGLGRP